MDANRFDSFARSIANWTSRRRFVGGLAGAAAGGLLGANRARAQGEEEPDPELIGVIVEFSTAANGELLTFSQEIEAYRQWGISQVNPDFDPFEFDPRFGQFVNDLITLTERGINASSWTTNDQVLDYFLTVNLIVGAVSAGGDTDVQLDQFAVAEFANRGMSEATPAVPNECISPIRPQTCTASCLDVWIVRETKFLSTGDMVALAEAFYFFIECFIWKGSITANAECLSTLIDAACAAKIACGCTGDCR